MASRDERLGDWMLDRQLGRGAMGVVWLGRHARTGAVAAIKIARTSKRASRLSIRREIAALMALNHPGVVRFLEEGEQDGVPWVAMEYVDGPTLTGAFTTSGAGATVALPTYGTTFDPEDTAAPMGAVGPQTAAVLATVCHTLAVVHAAGLVHRDLKPDNILIRGDGTPVLVDFGIFARTETALGREVVERQAYAAGTPGFMAPEQVAGDAVDARTDLFAIGRMLGAIVDPPPGIPELVERLCAHRPGDRPSSAFEVARAIERGFGLAPGRQAPPAPRLFRASWAGPPQTPAAVGRAIDRAVTRSRGAVVAITGPEGCGRSRVLTDAARAAARAGMVVLPGRCSRGARLLEGLEAPAAALTDALAGLPRTAAVKAAEEALAELTPAWSAAGLPEGRATAAAIEALLAAAAARPVLVVIDDLQWADDATLAVVRAIGPASEEAALVVLVAIPDASGLPDDVTRLEVGPLSRVRIGRLIQDSLGEGSLGPGVAAAIHWATEGVPLRAREMVHDLVATGQLVRRGERWGLGWGPDAPGHYLDQRIAGLSAADRSVATAAAVLDADADLAAVAVVSGLAEAEVVAALARLATARVAAEDGGVVRPLSDDVGRRLLASAADGLPDLRSRAADALADRPRAAAARIEHLLAAGRIAEAWPIARDEGPRLRAQGALAASVRAWDLVADHGPPDAAFEALYFSGMALAQLGRFPDTLARAQRALAVAHDDAMRCQARMLEAIARRAADPDGALPVIEEAVQLARAAGRTDLEAKAAFEHAFGLIRASHPDALTHLLAAIRLLEAEGDVAKAANGWSIASILADDQDKSDYVDRARALAARCSDRSVAAKLAVSTAPTLIALGRAAEAEAGWRDAGPVLRANGERPLEWHGCVDLARWLWLTGRASDALPRVDRARDLARDLRDPVYLARTHAVRAHVLAQLGRLREAQAEVEAGERVLETLHHVGLRGEIDAAAAHLWRRSGDPERARAHAEAVLANPAAVGAVRGIALVQLGLLAKAAGEDVGPWRDRLVGAGPDLGDLGRTLG